jgi:hypothetical protein
VQRACVPGSDAARCRTQESGPPPAVEGKLCDPCVCRWEGGLTPAVESVLQAVWEPMDLPGFAVAPLRLGLGVDALIRGRFPFRNGVHTKQAWKLACTRLRCEPTWGPRGSQGLRKPRLGWTGVGWSLKILESGCTSEVRQLCKDEGIQFGESGSVVFAALVHL